MRTKKKCEDACESCGSLWYDHLGMTGTCAKLEKAKQTLRAVSREMTHGFTADCVAIKQLCDKVLAEISGNPPQAKPKKKRSAK